MFSNISCFTALNKTKVLYIIKRKEQHKAGWGVGIVVLACDPSQETEGGGSGVLGEGTRDWEVRKEGEIKNKASLWSC